MVHQLARAYAVLGLRPGAPAREIRSRYRELARRWHPDRFAQDPQGQAEAAIQMRQINDAFKRIVASRTPVETQPPTCASPPDARLSRDEIERMVQSLGTDGPIDWLLGGLKGGWDWNEGVSRARMSATISWGVAILAQVIWEWHSIGKDGRPGSWTPLVVFIGAFLLLLRLLPKDAEPRR